MDIVLNKDKIAIRPMLDHLKDYQLLAKRLTDKTVLEFVYGRTNPQYLSKVKRRFRPKIYGHLNIRPCIFSYQNEEIGYLQYYPVNKAKEYELDDATSRIQLCGRN